jgi:hypothetical protein
MPVKPVRWTLFLGYIYVNAITEVGLDETSPIYPFRKVQKK